MTIDQHNTLIDKATTRKDGVYSYKGYLYAVKGNNFIAYADYFGSVFVCYGVFTNQIGKVERYDRRKTLKNLIQ